MITTFPFTGKPGNKGDIVELSPLSHLSTGKPGNKGDIVEWSPLSHLCTGKPGNKGDIVEWSPYRLTWKQKMENGKI